MPKPFLSPRNDVVFKMLFGDARNTSLLTEFLKSILDLPAEDYQDVILADSHLNGEIPDDKQGILDVKVRTPTGKVIDIEIQIADQPQMRVNAPFNRSLGARRHALPIPRHSCESRNP